jgi:hypothetical protein
LAGHIQTHLREKSGEIAHLKMTFSPDGGLGGIAVINLVRSDFVPELSQTLDEPTEGGQLIINLRAEAAPEVLRKAVDLGVRRLPLQFTGLAAKLEHLEHFRPGKPQPTHRIEASA